MMTEKKIKIIISSSGIVEVVILILKTYVMPSFVHAHSLKDFYLCKIQTYENIDKSVREMLL